MIITDYDVGKEGLFMDWAGNPVTVLRRLRTNDGEAVYAVLYQDIEGNERVTSVRGNCTIYKKREVTE